MGGPATAGPVILLRGMIAIAEHLEISTRQADHLNRHGLLPTFRLPGDSAPHATAGALEEWSAVRGASP